MFDADYYLYDYGLLFLSFFTLTFGSFIIFIDEKWIPILSCVPSYFCTLFCN